MSGTMLRSTASPPTNAPHDINASRNSNNSIPKFFFPHGKPLPVAEQERKLRKVVIIANHLFGQQPYILESQFVSITRACGLPRYMNIALFRRIDSLHQREERISFDHFVSGWSQLSQDRFDDVSLFFNILRKPGCAWLLPEDFLPVLEDIVLHHPGLRFLADNPMFQERYIETVICRLYYEARCPSGKMTMVQFRRSNFVQMIHSLGPNVDLNSTRDCFSYKHFYVLYCKFWTLDDDHDLIISEEDLAKYNQGALAPSAIQRIMQCGRIAAFARDPGASTSSSSSPATLSCEATMEEDQVQQQSTTITLTYLDYIWFLLSEVDKATPMAIEYWFRCLDTDGDGILSAYELEQFWREQEARNDLIQPRVRGQFRLQDLKRNGFLAERFFDTFLNFDRFQIHESYQGSIRAKRKEEMERRQRIHDGELIEESLLPIFDDSLGFFMISDWWEYAEIEYQQLLLSEQGDMICDEDDEEEENDDTGSFEDDEEEDEEDASQLEEACSTSDHDSDTSAPTTPTKDPITGASLHQWKQDSVSNTSSSTTMVQPSTNTSEQRQQQPQDPTTAQVWLWQPNTKAAGTTAPAAAVNDDEMENEEQGEDRAAEWVWLISSSHHHHQHLTNAPPHSTS
ncbi:hypothetical protein O0I10_005110 [Lichtheimia ornata]|uniref:EF-hand domain-containing protein n=1 Tax=Lichtheimia ornata TaxID=688661 RepID=A0AAD7V6W0_9FUNG|nr:uncharacterized protein O0I10_005110 [Lichtheimia ornata]KAJ8659072.1 hypothetical protein O0I10_005110 [Lichtheimia ornata]